MKRNIVKIVILICLLSFLVVACGTANPLKGTPLETTGKIYGFWNGLWDGMTAIFCFVVGLFSRTFREAHNIYQVHNNGGWYNFGFLMGVGAFARTATSSYKKRH